MTVVDYIKRKNAIIEKHTGLVLVPEDQIVEVPLKELCLTSYDSDIQACPYCLLYYAPFKCTGCPMEEADNSCFDSKSTYRQIVDDGPSIISVSAPWRSELIDLIEQYNDELLSQANEDSVAVRVGLTFEEFEEINHDELHCILGESGADRESEYSYDNQVEHIQNHPLHYAKYNLIWDKES